MNILKNVCCIFFITLVANIQASESERHVKFKSPLITRHRYEVESLRDYHKELREHNLQIGLQEDAIIDEMSQEEIIERDKRKTDRIITKEQEQAFLEPYNKINNALKFNSQELKKRIQEEQRVQKQNSMQEQEKCNSRLRTLSIIIIAGGVGLYYFNYHK